MARKILSNALFAAPLVLLALNVATTDEDAGHPYRAMLRDAVRGIHVQQEVFSADNERYAESVDELLAAGFDGFNPTGEAAGVYTVETTSDSVSVAVRAAYSGMPDVFCYLAYAAEEPPPDWRGPPALPFPSWYSAEGNGDALCTPGAPDRVPGGSKLAGLGTIANVSVMLAVFVSALLVAMQLVMFVLSKSTSPSKTSVRFVRELGPARVWSVLWVAGFLIYVALVPW